MNPELSHAIELMQTRFPEATCFAEQSLAAYNGGGKVHHFRLSIVRQGLCDAGQGDTIQSAFAALVSNAESPTTEGIERAKAILQSRGYSIAPHSNQPAP